jgi:hypothetical protein
MPQFQKGHARVGGRKKGTKNKLTTAALERLSELNCDPLEGMAKIAADKKNPIELRARMYAELAQYVYPKRRSMELSGVDGGAIETHDSAIESLASRVDSIAAALGEASVLQPVI